MSMTFKEALEYIYKVVKCREQDKAKCNGCESCSYNFKVGWTYKAEKAIAQYYEEECRQQKITSAQPKYEPVTAEDFAKTMSENTAYRFIVWHNEALTLMERYGFVICKKKT